MKRRKPSLLALTSISQANQKAGSMQPCGSSRYLHDKNSRCVICTSLFNHLQCTWTLKHSSCSCKKGIQQQPIVLALQIATSLLSVSWTQTSSCRLAAYNAQKAGCVLKTNFAVSFRKVPNRCWIASQYLFIATTGACLCQKTAYLRSCVPTRHNTV